MMVGYSEIDNPKSLVALTDFTSHLLYNGLLMIFQTSHQTMKTTENPKTRPHSQPMGPW
jgi:hypothetical protein